MTQRRRPLYKPFTTPTPKDKQLTQCHSLYNPTICFLYILAKILSKENQNRHMAIISTDIFQFYSNDAPARIRSFIERIVKQSRRGQRK
jgi:hypothetical protein